MAIIKSSLMTWSCLAAAAAVASLMGTSGIRAATTCVLTLSQGGPAAFMNSGLNDQSFWSLGSSGNNSFSNTGNEAYSAQTGGDISPMEANVAAETLTQFVVDEGGNQSAEPTMVAGGQLVQVDSNQEFISELFGAPGQTGAPAFNSSLPENSPIFFQTVNKSTLPPGGYIDNGLNTTTITVTVPTPEPAALSLMAVAGAGLVLLSRRSLARMLPVHKLKIINN